MDASVQTASIALSNKNKLLGLKVCEQQRTHAAFIQPAIQELLKEQSVQPHELSAIAVTEGPGSYTGLRIAMASAKGLCYALNIPLITLGTLDVMMYAAALQVTADDFLLCPMIDARRMEVFTCITNQKNERIVEPQALILNENSFDTLLEKHRICFFGNGSDKWQKICLHQNAVFINVSWDASVMIEKAFEKYQSNQFASLTYAVPLYLKEFYTIAKQT
jgi:tRNA threonylcarbamoyladenosine biosynthesis protein TsaB